MSNLLKLMLETVETVTADTERAKNHIQTITKLPPLDRGQLCYQVSILREAFVKEIAKQQNDLGIAKLTTELMRNINTVMKNV